MCSATVISPIVSSLNVVSNRLFNRFDSLFPRADSNYTTDAADDEKPPLNAKCDDQTLSLQMDGDPIISIRGTINETNYLSLINLTQSIYEKGHRQIKIDLNHCTNVKLSGLFALYSIHAIFRGDIPPSVDEGMHGLRQLAFRHRSQGAIDNVIITNPSPKVADILTKNALVSGY